MFKRADRLKIWKKNYQPFVVSLIYRGGGGWRGGQQVPHGGVSTGCHAAQQAALTHPVWRLYTDPGLTPRQGHKKGPQGRGSYQQGRCLLLSVPLRHLVACRVRSQS